MVVWRNQPSLGDTSNGECDALGSIMCRLYYLALYSRSAISRPNLLTCPGLLSLSQQITPTHPLGNLQNHASASVVPMVVLPAACAVENNLTAPGHWANCTLPRKLLSSRTVLPAHTRMDTSTSYCNRAPHTFLLGMEFWSLLGLAGARGTGFWSLARPKPTTQQYVFYTAPSVHWLELDTKSSCRSLRSPGPCCGYSPIPGTLVLRKIVGLQL